ncbi:MAG: SseB family protein [Paracoccus sp. (in: a-proteobacteria)]
MTPLDALCAMPFHELPGPERARVLGRLADTALFVALEGEPVGDKARLHLFDLAGGKVALASDSEDRLAGFFGAATAYAELPGRVLAGMLAADGVGLMVNPGTRSEMLLDGDVLGWLAEALTSAPQEDEVVPARLFAPAPDMVAALADPLALRLGDMVGLTEQAALVAARWPGSAAGHLIVLTGADEASRPRLAKAIAELIAFLPPLPQPCDVAFDLPLPRGALILRPEAAEKPASPSGPRAPGSDPEKPPILRF